MGLVAFVLGLAAPALASPAQAQVGAGEPLWRYERQIPGLGTLERTRCTTDGVCWNRHEFGFRAVVSAPYDYLAVRATVRMTYRTTRRDRAHAIMRYLINPPPPIACCEIPRMNPRYRVLLPSRAWRRARLTWSAPLVNGRGREWSWGMELNPRDTNRNGRTQVFARAVSIVLEGWPAAPPSN